MPENYLDKNGLAYFLGKLNGKYVGKVTTSTSKAQAYIKLANGNQSMTDCDYSNNGSTICLRDAYGRVRVAAPTTDNEASNKKYVDDLVPQIRKFVR